MTVGDAPVHIAGQGVIVTERTDSKYGRVICEYTIDPNYAADLTAQRICDGFESMDADGLAKVMGLLVTHLPAALAANNAACTALVAGLISGDAANTIRAGQDGKLFENDATL